jgi:hypothetical protein
MRLLNENVGVEMSSKLRVWVGAPTAVDDLAAPEREWTNVIDWKKCSSIKASSSSSNVEKLHVLDSCDGLTLFRIRILAVRFACCQCRIASPLEHQSPGL